MTSTPSNLHFLCPGQTSGAILILPHGAIQEDARNLRSFREYAMQHAVKWYQYVNGPRGREASNGSLYLVTGCVKAKSWGIASFPDASNVNAGLSLKFSSGSSDDTSNHRWHQSGAAVTKAGPALSEQLQVDGHLAVNQCTFVRGFRIALGDGLWAGLMNPVKVSEIVGAKPKSLLSRSNFIPFSRGGSALSRYWNAFRGRGDRRQSRSSSTASTSSTISFRIPLGSAFLKALGAWGSQSSSLDSPEPQFHMADVVITSDIQPTVRSTSS